MKIFLNQICFFSGGAGGSLASLYQARKQGAPLPMLPPSMLTTPTSVKKSSEGASNGNGSSHYDATTVEQIKAQFQAQIEAMMLSQVRNWLQEINIAGGYRNALTFWVVHVIYLVHHCNQQPIPKL